MKKIGISMAMALLIAVALGGCNKEFAVERVSPEGGVLAGGEPVDILGQGFEPGMGITVYFGTSKADNVVVQSSGKMTVTTPSSNTEQAVDVRVITDGGDEFVLKNAFHYWKKGGIGSVQDMGQRKSIRD
ncbi:MAG: IPT/TIG domain-containing protein [Polyangia bacterium]